MPYAFWMSGSACRISGSAVRGWCFRGELEKAAAETHELLPMARQLRNAEILAAVIDIHGCVRIELGDWSGLDQINEAIELARDVRSGWIPYIRSDLAIYLIELGQFDRAFEVVAQVHSDAERLGNRPFLDWVDLMGMRSAYWTGRWDEASRLAKDVLARMTRAESDVRCRCIRGQIALGRDRVDEAIADTSSALAAGRAGRYLMALHSALAVRARACLAAGKRDEATELVGELTERFIAEGTQMQSATLPDFSVAALELGRADEFQKALAAIKRQTPWLEAARSFAQQDFEAAASTYEQIGSLPDAAYAWLRAAKALVEQGRSASAGDPAQRALTFYRSVGAIRYVREGESLIAATG